VGLTAASPAARAAGKEEQEIRGLEQRFAAAVRAKDVDAIMKAYVPGRELFVFDVDPRASTLASTTTRKTGRASLAPSRVRLTSLKSMTFTL